MGRECILSRLGCFVASVQNSWRHMSDPAGALNAVSRTQFGASPRRKKKQTAMATSPWSVCEGHSAMAHDRLLRSVFAEADRACLGWEVSRRRPASREQSA